MIIGHDEDKTVNEVNLPQEYIVLSVPSTTCEITITAKIFSDGGIRTVHSTLGFEEVREAIKEAQDCYIPSDAEFTLTPLGEKKLQELEELYSDLTRGIDAP